MTPWMQVNDTHLHASVQREQARTMELIRASLSHADETGGRQRRSDGIIAHSVGAMPRRAGDATRAPSRAVARHDSAMMKVPQ